MPATHAHHSSAPPAVNRHHHITLVRLPPAAPPANQHPLPRPTPLAVRGQPRLIVHQAGLLAFAEAAIEAIEERLLRVDGRHRGGGHQTRLSLIAQLLTELLQLLVGLLQLSVDPLQTAAEARLCLPRQLGRPVNSRLQLVQRLQ